MKPDDPRPWKVLAREYIDHKPWFTVRKDRVRLPNGEEIAEYFVHEFTPWVNVVAVTQARELVLVRQYRHGLGAIHYELPAGTAARGEPPEQAARRELLEETGYGGGRWRKLMAISANPATHDNLSHSFVAEGVARIAAPSLDATEDLRVHLVPLSDALDLVDQGQMVQALQIAPLLRYLMMQR